MKHGTDPLFNEAAEFTTQTKGKEMFTMNSKILRFIEISKVDLLQGSLIEKTRIWSQEVLYLLLFIIRSSWSYIASWRMFTTLH